MSNYSNSKRWYPSKELPWGKGRWTSTDESPQVEEVTYYDKEGNKTGRERGSGSEGSEGSRASRRQSASFAR